MARGDSSPASIATMRLVEQRQPFGDVAQVDQHAALADAGDRDELAVGEAGTDLAGVDEVGVRTRDVTGLEDPQHPQPPLEVALLDAVDVRLVQEPGACGRPSLGSGRRSPLNPKPWASFPPK